MTSWFKSFHAWCNKHEWIIFLLVVVLILRLPSLMMPHYYGDEEIYFVMGRAWATGVPLYQAIFDHKPPLIYILAGIAPTMFAFRGVLTVLMMLHTVLFANLAGLIWDKTKPIMKYASTLIFVALSTLPTFEGLTVNAELLMMIPVTGAVLILWNMRADTGVRQIARANTRIRITRADTGVRPHICLLAGLLGGIGWLFKIPVVFDMMAIGLYFFVFNKKTFKEGLSAILSWSFLAYGLAFVAPLAATFVYYYLKGTGPDYLGTVLTMNLGYVSSWSTSTYTFNPFRSGLVVRGTILGFFTLLLYLARKKIDKKLVFLSLWAGFSLFGALLSARPYPHYLQEMVVPVSLLIPFVFVAENVLSWILIGSLVIAGIATQWKIQFWGYPTISVYKTYWEYVTRKISWDEYLARFDNAPRNYSVAKYLNERLTPSDTIYLWGTDATIYNLTSKLPSGGKYIVSFHVRDLKKYDYVMENLNKSEPKYIVILPGAGEFDALMTMVAHDYVQVKEIGDINIYMRLK